MLPGGDQGGTPENWWCRWALPRKMAGMRRASADEIAIGRCVNGVVRTETEKDQRYSYLNFRMARCLAVVSIAAQQATGKLMGQRRDRLSRTG